MDRLYEFEFKLRAVLAERANALHFILRNRSGTSFLAQERERRFFETRGYPPLEAEIIRNRMIDLASYRLIHS